MDYRPRLWETSAQTARDLAGLGKEEGVFPFLWGRRREALYSPEYTLPELLELEERIEAHVQGLLVGAEHTIPFVEDGLSQDEPLEVFAAAYTLLRLNIDFAARQVMDAFLQAEGKQLD